MKDDNYEIDDDFVIDKHRLDDEWLVQPKLMSAACQEAAQARYEHDVAKAELKQVEAEVSMDIRSRPDRYGISKVTDKAIESAMLLTPDYQDAHKALLKAKLRMDLCQGKVDSLEHRKKALENLVWLFGQDYFSSPSATKATPEAMRKVAEDRDEPVRGVRPKRK